MFTHIQVYIYVYTCIHIPLHILIDICIRITYSSVYTAGTQGKTYMYAYIYIYIYTYICTAGKWWKCDPISEHRLRLRLGRAMNLVDWLHTSADERVLSGRRAVVICVMGCLRGLVVLHRPFASREQSLDHSRAWIPACSAVFPPIFLQLRKGPL